jgi:dUTP pyrophosphatase
MSDLTDLDDRTPCRACNGHGRLVRYTSDGMMREEECVYCNGVGLILPARAIPTLKVRRLRPDARLPTKAHADDAAFDLHAVEPIRAEMSGVYRIPTGIAAEIPAGWFALILGRSSLAARGIFPVGGVIDASYRGEWVVCQRVGEIGLPWVVRPGDKVAQFVLLPVPAVVPVEVAELGPSERGARGFGSSGR